MINIILLNSYMQIWLDSVLNEKGYTQSKHAEGFCWLDE